MNNFSLDDLINDLTSVGLAPIVITDAEQIPDTPVEDRFTFTKEHYVWTLSEGDEVLGWVSQIKQHNVEHHYRAVSAISNRLEWFYSLADARSWLIEQSY